MAGERPHYAEQLRGDLLEAARRRAHRPRGRARIARVGATVGAVVVAVVAAILFTQVGGERSASAGVDIKVEGGRISVRLTDLEHRPSVIESAVRKAGIDVSVTAAPVGPSLVGKFVTDTSTGPLDEIVQPTDVDGLGNFGGFLVPVGWPGHLTLVVGRPAAHGEQYARASDAFAPGEPLHCSALVGLTGTDALAHLPDPQVRFRFRAVDPATLAAVDLDRNGLASSPYLALKVAGGQAVSDHDIVLTLTADGLPIQRGAPTTSTDKC